MMMRIVFPMSLAFVGLTVANILYQSMKVIPNWEVAAERSFFQLIAIVTFGGLTLFLNKQKW